VSREVPGYLGPYRLLNVVHTGRVYQIWQAYDDAYNRMVGIKVVLDQFRNDREQLRYLRTEFSVGQSLVNPHVISIYGFDHNGGKSYLAMEWFSAPNLKQRIQQGVEKLAPLATTIIEQAAEALISVHWAGWIHRDIKPDNFLVADDGTVKLIDFALAVRRRRGLGRRLLGWFARRSKVQGTRSYMAPEQIRGGRVDERTDLYGLACTVYELLSARPPFVGNDPDEVLMKHLKSAPPSLEATSPLVAPELAQLIRRAMAKDPDGRPNSVADFLREFRTIRRFRPAKSPNL
jgi:eukaryotic-like serine/threonine-protein kinase